MNQAPSPEFIQPEWFFPVFVLMWVSICALLSMVGGWMSLATEFRATQRAEGQRFRFVCGSMGVRLLPVNYGGCLFVTVNDTGFRLSILLPFRLLSPPLFIHWKDVASVETKRFLFVSRAIVRLHRHWPAISIYGAAGKSVADAYARVSESTTH